MGEAEPWVDEIYIPVGTAPVRVVDPGYNLLMVEKLLDRILIGFEHFNKLKSVATISS
jgi:hypothetical protein